MTRVLVTGADGFTGRHLVSALIRRGHDVHAMVKETLAQGDSLRQRPVRIHKADISDRDALRAVVNTVRPQSVVHLAAVSFVAHGDVEAIYRINILGTRNLLAALADTAVLPDSIVLASSANVYGNARQEVISESVVPVPENDYAVSKLAMEHMANTWSSRLPIQLVRPFNYTGIGQSERFVLAKIVSHYKRRAAVIELGNLEVERDFSDVRMVADCYCRLIENHVQGPVLNICSGTGYSLLQVLGTMETLTGHRPEIQVNPAFIRQNEVFRLIGSKAELERKIGALACPPLEQTLSWMLGD